MAGFDTVVLADDSKIDGGTILIESTQIRAVSVSDFFNFPSQKIWNLESMALTEAVSYP